jgi:hypothetical protein
LPNCPIIRKHTSGRKFSGRKVQSKMEKSSRRRSPGGMKGPSGVQEEWQDPVLETLKGSSRWWSPRGTEGSIGRMSPGGMEGFSEWRRDGRLQYVYGGFMEK